MIIWHGMMKFFALPGELSVNKSGILMAYLSVVVTSRNDVDAASLRRMQLFVDSFLTQAERYRLDAELIIVEWNPPAEKPGLADMLRAPSLENIVPVRIIQVPPEIHSRYANAERIPLFQMIAKNAGIRRAHGRFVLATNVDILFSNELIAFLATQPLDVDRMYRMDRYDVPTDVPLDVDLDERLQWCDTHLLRVNRHLETVPVENGTIPPRKIVQKPPVKKVLDLILPMDPFLHSNACGDFTILSRESWHKTNGYAEFPMRAMKIDSLLCYTAHYSGAKEMVLADPMRVYHIEHAPRGDGASVALSNRPSDSTQLQVTHQQYRAWIDRMRRWKRPVIFNGKDWGLANESLAETTLGLDVATR